MMFFTDQTQRTIELNHFPERIVSVVPSQTELLFDLNLDDEVIGITKFCIHPDQWFRTKERVGGTKSLNLQKIIELKPDLILANKEENTKEDLEALMQHCAVWISDIKNLSDACSMIHSVGEMCNRRSIANELVSEIRNQIPVVLPELKSAVYLIWNDPIMAAGTDTFISDMLPYAGFSNVVIKERYPALSDQELQTLNPQYILLSSEPFPFNNEHRLDYEKRFPESTILLVDGECFSWYGSRMRLAFPYFRLLTQQLTGN